MRTRKLYALAFRYFNSVYSLSRVSGLGKLCSVLSSIRSTSSLFTGCSIDAYVYV